MFVHLTLLPYLRASGEIKTKPTQQSVGKLREIGIQPDVLICRTEQPMSDEMAQEDHAVLQRAARGGDRGARRRLLDLRGAADAGRAGPRPHRSPSTLELPRDARPTSATGTRMLAEMQPHATTSVEIARRRQVHRAARRLQVDLRGARARRHRQQLHGARAQGARRGRTPRRAAELLDGRRRRSSCPAASASAASRARSRRSATRARTGLPFFGICLGMQCAVIEFARNVLRPDSAPHAPSSTPHTPHPVIHLMPDQSDLAKKGGTMRLGAYALPRSTPARWRTGSTAPIRSPSATATATSSTTTTAQRSPTRGLVISGINPERDLVEIDRAPRPPVLRRRPVPPRVQEPPAAPPADLQGLRRGRAGARAPAERRPREGREDADQAPVAGSLRGDAGGVRERPLLREKPPANRPELGHLPRNRIAPSGFAALPHPNGPARAEARA